MDRNLVSDRLENVTQTISRLLEGYDIRLRPNFGGKLWFFSTVYIDKLIIDKFHYFSFNKLFFNNIE